jgi:inward rectifier potassium channel
MTQSQKPVPNDLGFGVSNRRKRALNKDGTFNVDHRGVKVWERIDLYHELVTMSNRKFLFWVFIAFFFVNFLFAGIYMWIGTEHLTGIDNTSRWTQFTEAFFFSSQTLTTLGYGRIAPIGALASSVAAIESMMGLMTFALATGLLFARFSRPKRHIRYSEVAVMAPYNGGTAFMFRAVNYGKNQLIEVEANINCSYQMKDSPTRSFVNLKLERAKVNFFPTNWTVVHPIDEDSALVNWTEKDFHDRDVEFIVMLKAFDETSGQTIYSRRSYIADEIEFGKKFVPMFGPQENGSRPLLMDKLSETEFVK